MKMEDDVFRQAVRKHISGALGIHPLQVSASKPRFVEINNTGTVSLPTKHEGLVRKRGQLNTAFEERYFILSDGKLKNYQKRSVLLDEPHLTQSNSMILRGLMHCSGMIVQALPDEGEGFEFMITLREGHHDGRHVVCCVDTEDERNVWVQKLRSAAEELDAEPETMPGSLLCHVHFIACRDAAWIMATPDFCVRSDALGMSNGPQAQNAQRRLVVHDEIEEEETEEEMVEFEVVLGHGMTLEDISGAEDEFKAAITMDVATAVRGDVSKARMLGTEERTISVEADSIVVKLGLAPGICGDNMTALNAARDLRRQASDPTSILLDGTYTRYCTSLRVTAVPKGYGHSCSCLSRAELIDAFLAQCTDIGSPLRQGAIFSQLTAAASWRHDYKHLACRLCGLTPDLCTCECPGCHEKLDSCPVDCQLAAELPSPPQYCQRCPSVQGPAVEHADSTAENAVKTLEAGTALSRDLFFEPVTFPPGDGHLGESLQDIGIEIHSGDAPPTDPPLPFSAKPLAEAGAEALVASNGRQVTPPPSPGAVLVSTTPEPALAHNPVKMSHAPLKSRWSPAAANVAKPAPGMRGASTARTMPIEVSAEIGIVSVARDAEAMSQYIGLQVTREPPHSVLQVHDLVDVNFVRHDEAGYCNPHIDAGDRILAVNESSVEHLPIETLHECLLGPLHAPVTISLVRPTTGQMYEVTVLRHNFHAFDHEQHKRARAMERAAVHARFRPTGHYAGLQVTTQPPHRVVAVDDLMDANFVRQGERGYLNQEVRAGDYILSIDGQSAVNVTIQELHALLTGPEHSLVEFRFARPQGEHPTLAFEAAEFSIIVLRHHYHEFWEGTNPP